MQPVIQSAFTSGELSPSLHGRQDLAKYDSAARFIQNFIIRPAGGASKRPGTRFVGYSNAGAGFTTPPRLIPFVFNQQQTYVLEFGFDSGGAGKIRFITDAGFVVDGAAAVYSIAHPYTVAELPEVNYTQANDIITLVHRNHPIRQLKRYGHSNWVLELMEFNARIKAPWRPAVIKHTPINTKKARQFKVAVVSDSSASNRGPFSDAVLSVAESTLSATEFIRVNIGVPSDLPPASTVRIGVWDDDATPGTFIFYGSILTTTGKSQVVLNRTNLAAVGGAGGPETLTTKVPWFSVESVTTKDTAVGVDDSNYAYKIVSIAEDGEESTPSTETAVIHSLTATDGYNRIEWAPPHGANLSISATAAMNQGVTITPSPNLVSQLLYPDGTAGYSTSSVHKWEDQTGLVLGTGSSLTLTAGHLGKTIKYTIVLSSVIDGISVEVDRGSIQFINPVAVSGNPSESVELRARRLTYKVYRSKDGGQVQYIATTKSTSLVDTNLPASTSPQEPLNLFSKAGDYPGAVTYFQQRLVFAGSNNSPMSIWFSKTGDSSSFTKHSPLIDDDAMSITIAANETSQIQHLVPLGDLLVLTSGGEWRVSGSQSQDALTPSNIAATPQGTRGSSALRPIAIGTRTIFLQRLSKTVRAIAYSWEADGYQSEDLTLLADHLTEENTITDWAFAQSPHGHLYCLRDDGVILVCTLLLEQQVIAWSRIKLDYPVQALCVIPENGRDTLYLAAQTYRRTKTGSTYTPLYESAIARLEELPLTQADTNAVDMFMDAYAPVVTTVSATVVGNSAPSAGVGFESILSFASIKVATAANMTGIINVGDSVLIEGMQGFCQIYGGAEPKWMHPPTTPYLNNRPLSVLRVDTDGIVLDSAFDFHPNFSDTESIPKMFTRWISGGTIKKNLTLVTGGLEIFRDRWVSVITDGQGGILGKITADTASTPSLAFDVNKPFHVRVGLPFVAELKTLPPGGQMLPGGRKRINRVRLRVQETAGLEVAPDLGDDDETALWQPVRPDDGSTSLAPGDQVCKSFIFTQPVDPNWTTQGGLRLRSTSPLPCTILNVIPEVENGN